jgi:hypothetical protein
LAALLLPLLGDTASCILFGIVAPVPAAGFRSRPRCENDEPVIDLDDLFSVIKIANMIRI